MTAARHVTSLQAGGHRHPGEGVCLVEAASLLAGEPFSDHPRCVCPVIARLARGVNDTAPDQRRQDLLPIAPLLPGTRADARTEAARRTVIFGWWVWHTARWLGLLPEFAMLSERIRLTPVTTTRRDTEQLAARLQAAATVAEIAAEASGGPAPRMAASVRTSTEAAQAQIRRVNTVVGDALGRSGRLFLNPHKRAFTRLEPLASVALRHTILAASWRSGEPHGHAARTLDPMTAWTDDQIHGLLTHLCLSTTPPHTKEKQDDPSHRRS